jgi:hypothetical protein
MKEALISPKRRFLQGPQGVTSQKTPFFIVTAVKTSNLTDNNPTHKTAILIITELRTSTVLVYGGYTDDGSSMFLRNVFNIVP